MPITSNALRARATRLNNEVAELLARKTRTRAEDKRLDKLLADAEQAKRDVDRIERLEILDLEAMREVPRRYELFDGRVQGRGVMDAFDAYLRGGIEALDHVQRAVFDLRFRSAMGVGGPSEGGFLVPDGFDRSLVEAEKAFGGMLDAGATILDTETGNPLGLPTDDDTGNTGAIVGENASMADGADLTFKAVTFGSFLYSSKPIRVSQQLLQDSAFDVAAFIARKGGIRIARLLNQHFTTGDGASKPIGVMTDATRGVTAASASTIAWDELTDLEHSVDPAYRKNARFMLNDDMLRVIQKLKDGTGMYLWAPGSPKDGIPPTIKGYPYVVNQQMDAVAPSAKPIAFGDFSHYHIRRIAGARVLRLVERYADYNQVGFLLFQRWDGNLVDAGTHPVKYLQMAAS